jgi:transcriptional regulator with XRE-family HTH domain
MADLAGFLEREFSRRQWSIRKAEAALGIDKSTLGKILNDRDQIPRLPTLKKLADGLGITLGKLIAEAGFIIGDDPRAEQMLLGLTDEQIEWWLNLPPSRRAMLLDALQRLYPDAGDP